MIKLGTLLLAKFTCHFSKNNQSVIVKKGEVWFVTKQFCDFKEMCTDYEIVGGEGNYKVILRESVVLKWFTEI
jgi:hypothetical protein